MSDPGAELARLAAWQHAQRKALIGQQCARADLEAAEAERAEAARAADAADLREFRAWRRVVTGEPPMSLAGVLERWRMAEDAPVRDLSQPVGSESNPDLRVGDVWLGVASRSLQQGDGELLDQARRNREDLFMRGQVARYRQRRGGRRVISRGAGDDEPAACLDCAELNASQGESVLIHLEEGAPPPRYVPDHPPDEPPARSRPSWWQGEIARCGTGWPD